MSLRPKRAFDSRQPQNAPALGANATRTVDLSAVVDSTTATAVVLNLTVTDPTTGGYLTLFPADGSARPLASSINFRPGETRSNDVTVALPPGTNADKAIQVYNQNGSTQVIIDVLGYYDPNRVNTSTGSYYVPATPFRAFDSRTTGGPLAAGAARTITLPKPGSLTQVTSVAVNLTAVNPTGPGYLRASSGVGTRPFVSSVNYGSDPVTPNFAIVPAVQAEDGTISFLVDNNVSTTDALVDVVGYYTGQLGTNAYLYQPVAPQRLDDTRDAGESPLAQNEKRDYNLDALPFGVTAVNLNVTAVDATQPTYLTVYPIGVSRPVASNLNPFTPYPLANAVQTGIAAADDTNAAGFTVYNQAGRVDVVVDLQGYFVGLD